MDIFEDGVAASGYTNATFQAAILYIKAMTTAYPVVTFTAKQRRNGYTFMKNHRNTILYAERTLIMLFTIMYSSTVLRKL